MFYQLVLMAGPIFSDGIACDILLEQLIRPDSSRGGQEGQSVSGRLAPLLRLWLPQSGLSEGQLVSANPVSPLSADTEPTARSAPKRPIAGWSLAG